MDFLNKNFKILRELNGLNQAQLSISLGFSRGAWNNYETGKSKPNIDDFIKISKYFGYSASDLLEKDLEFAHLNKIDTTKKEEVNAHLNQYVNAHPNPKKAQKEPCEVCIVKDTLLALKDQIIEGKIQLIHSLEAQIMLLQNQQETKAFEPVKGRKTHTTPKEDRKTA